MTLLQLAGAPEALALLFPAAATITTPWLQAQFIMSRSDCEQSPSRPRLMLMTLAPFWTAQATPFRMFDVEPLPLSPSTLALIRLTPGAMPEMPMPLLPVAATIPATWVPWLQLSSKLDEPLKSWFRTT